MKLSGLSIAVPLWIKIAIIAAVVVAIAAGIRGCADVIDHRTDAAIAAAESKGASRAAAAAATKGLEHVEQGNRAAAAIDRDDGARRAGCLRHSRTPEYC